MLIIGWLCGLFSWSVCHDFWTIVFIWFDKVWNSPWIHMIFVATPYRKPTTRETKTISHLNRLFSGKFIIRLQLIQTSSSHMKPSTIIGSELFGLSNILLSLLSVDVRNTLHYNTVPTEDRTNQFNCFWTNSRIKYLFNYRTYGAAWFIRLQCVCVCGIWWWRKFSLHITSTATKIFLYHFI